MWVKNDKLLNRSYYYDNIKGFLIILVVFAHCIYDLQHFPLLNAITDAIYMFHMPAFVFVSGYFGKSSKAGSFNSIIKLVFLYFVCNSIAALVTGAESLLYPLYSYWYLVALIVWRITADKIAKFKEIMLILFAISIFAGFYSSLDNTFSISRIIAFYPFYMTGYLLGKEKSEEIENKPYKKRFLMGMLISAGLIVVGVIAYKIFGYSDSDLLMFPYSNSIDALGRIVLYLIAFGAIYALRLFGLNKKIPFISSFGRNSLGIFLLHRPLTILFSNIFRTNTVLILILSVVVTFVICLLFGNDYVSGAINKITDGFAELFSEKEKDKKNVSKAIAQVIVLCVALCFVGEFVVRYYKNYVFIEEEPEIVVTETDEIYPVMSYSDEKKIENS
ncbi:MAG: acyltransferase family protein, partial [Oscillospiraceae bacterium]|nr:acyltransferase family protein [Oscillospiraceae bacterium]